MNGNLEYKILNYWNDTDDLYVEYTVTKNDAKAHVIDYYNTSDIGCNYNTTSSEEIKNNLLKLIKKNNGSEFNLPKVSELSSLLKYVYNSVCENESNMCHIDYNDWEELKEDYEFFEEDLATLKREIQKYNLDNYITIDENEYKICGYGCLQCCFNDDTMERNDDFER